VGAHPYCARSGGYFAYATELLKLHPPHVTDEPILAQMKKIGIEGSGG
jgi:hypothetical protein